MQATLSWPVFVPHNFRSLCEAVLNDAMFELPESEVKTLKVTKSYAEQRLAKLELPALKVVS